MKYIIMKAQEAREFEDLGDLTITKLFKPAPPYIEGAVLEQTDGGNWRLVDDTRRPIEGRPLHVPEGGGRKDGVGLQVCESKCRPPYA